MENNDIDVERILPVLQSYREVDMKAFYQVMLEYPLVFF
jgi:hypothetical protein